MSLIQYVPASGYDASEGGVIRVGGDREIDIHAALANGGGVITVDDAQDRALVRALDKFPGLTRSDVASPVQPTEDLPVVSIHAREVASPQPGDMIVRGNNGEDFEVVGASSGGVALGQAVDNRVGARQRSILAANYLIDPRATTAANYGQSAGGAGAVTVQGLTQRNDGMHQAARPMTCQEIIITAGALTNWAGIGTHARLSGHAVAVNPTKPLVAARCAFKVSGNLGNSWYMNFYIQYYDATGAFITQVPVWSAGPNQIQTGQWYVAEGFDAQSFLSFQQAAFVECAVLINQVTPGNNVTMRATEFVLCPDSATDIPDYVGGDMPGGVWNGTADASSSYRQFDPVDAYPKKPMGVNNFENANMATWGQAGPHSPNQAIGMYQHAGLDTARVPLSLAVDNGPNAAPGALPLTLALLQQYVAAGLKIILCIGGGPPSMAPTALGLTQAGNAGGTVAAGAVSMNVTGALPANFPALPQPISWNDGSGEIATLTALASGVATITRGVAGPKTLQGQSIATAAAQHADGVTLIDAWHNNAFGHCYYPDASKRALYAQGIVNVIQALGPDNVYAVECGNEPNLYLCDTRNEGAAGYTAWANSVYDAVKAAFPNMKVMSGVVAYQQAIGGSATGIDATTFTNALFTAGLKMDMFDAHLYVGGPLLGPGGTPTSGIDINQSAVPPYTGFDGSIKRVKDALTANGQPNMPIFASEFGHLADKPNEVVQGQVAALMAGRMLRDPQIAGMSWNGLTVQRPGKWGLYTDNNQRARPMVRHWARMRARPNVLNLEDVLRWTPGSGADEPGAALDNIFPWTQQLCPFFGFGGQAFGDMYVVQGTWSIAVGTGSVMNAIGYNNSNAQNDEGGFQVPLAKGMYVMTALMQKNVGNAIATLMVDGQAQSPTFDGYNAALTYTNAWKVPFTVNWSGNHNVTHKATGRNASNTTGWTMGMQVMQLRRVL